VCQYHALPLRLTTLAFTVSLSLLALASGATPAQAASAARCALTERDQNPPGGTAAYNLSLRKRDTSCEVAKKVMVAFHRCRTDGRAGCAKRVLATWRCRGRRSATLPLGKPRVFDGSFVCASGRRRAEGAYQENTPACFGAVVRDPLRPCVNPTLAIYPTSDDPHALDPGAAGCQDDPVGACVFGTAPDKAKGHFAIVGDSHSLHWRGALSVIARTYSLRGYSHSTGGCFFSTAARLFLEGCGDWYQATANWFTAHPEVDTVFVTANADTPVAVEAGTTSREVKVDGFKRAFQALPKTVEHIIVLRDTPASSQPTFDCIARVLTAGKERIGPACALERPTGLREDLAVVAARELKSDRYGVIDLTRYFCGPSKCYPVIGGVLVNGDVWGHITVSYMRTVGPYLLRAYRRLRADRRGA
jgi:hypothetical protein